jgi:hypothetical protein
MKAEKENKILWVMVALLAIAVLCLMGSGCATINAMRYPCLREALALCDQNPGAVIIAGIDIRDEYHCEAVFDVAGVYLPLDGDNTLKTIIPQNEYLVTFTAAEARMRWPWALKEPEDKD